MIRYSSNTYFAVYETCRLCSWRKVFITSIRMNVVGPTPSSWACILISFAVSGSKRTLNPSDKFLAKWTLTGLNSSSNSVVSCVSQNSASSSRLLNEGIAPCASVGYSGPLCSGCVFIFNLIRRDRMSGDVFNIPDPPTNNYHEPIVLQKITTSRVCTVCLTRLTTFAILQPIGDNISMRRDSGRATFFSRICGIMIYP